MSAGTPDSCPGRRLEIREHLQVSGLACILFDFYPEHKGSYGGDFGAQQPGGGCLQAHVKARGGFAGKNARRRPPLNKIAWPEESGISIRFRGRRARRETTAAKGPFPFPSGGQDGRREAGAGQKIGTYKPKSLARPKMAWPDDAPRPSLRVAASFPKRDAGPKTSAGLDGPAAVRPEASPVGIGIAHWRKFEYLIKYSFTQIVLKALRALARSGCARRPGPRTPRPGAGAPIPDFAEPCPPFPEPAGDGRLLPDFAEPCPPPGDRRCRSTHHRFRRGLPLPFPEPAGDGRRREEPSCRSRASARLRRSGRRLPPPASESPLGGNLSI
jgi:hypothetical protein